MIAALALLLAATAAAAAPVAGDVPLSTQLASGPQAAASHPHHPLRASVSPAVAPVGARFVYRGWVLVPQGTPVRFEPPSSGGELTWGEVHAGRQMTTHPPDASRHWGDPVDSVWVETSVQVFTPGRTSLPGLTLEVGSGANAVRGRLPVVSVVVASELSAADSNADLRPVRGPYAAPWWERVPWTQVVLVVVALAAIVALIVWLRRRHRRRVVAPAPVAVASGPRRSPGEEALAALAELRGRQLPEQGRFAEHAFELTRITRRFLEQTLVTPRPGDTSAELVDRLRSGALGAERLDRLTALLSLWDRVKFARAPLTVAEARRAEDAVEAFVARPASEPPREVA